MHAEMTYSYTHTPQYTHIHTSQYTHIHTPRYTHTHARTHTHHPHSHSDGAVSTRCSITPWIGYCRNSVMPSMHTMCTHINTYIHTCTHSHIHSLTYTLTHIHTHIHTHTYTHSLTYTHSHAHKSSQGDDPTVAPLGKANTTSLLLEVAHHMGYVRVNTYE